MMQIENENILSQLCQIWHFQLKSTTSIYLDDKKACYQMLLLYFKKVKDKARQQWEMDLEGKGST